MKKTTIQEAKDKAFKLTGKVLDDATAKKAAAFMDEQKRRWIKMDKDAEKKGR